MKNTYQKGAVGVIVIILILLAGAVGFYFYTADKADDVSEGVMIEDEIGEIGDTEEPVGFEETPISTSTEISIKDFAFMPAVTTVKAGTTITWTNDDSAAHTVTSDTEAFDSGNLEKGKIFSMTFDESGTYSYFCKWHPNMKGTIIVTE